MFILDLLLNYERTVAPSLTYTRSRPYTSAAKKTEEKKRRVPLDAVFAKLLSRSTAENEGSRVWYYTTYDVSILIRV